MRSKLCLLIGAWGGLLLSGCPENKSSTDQPSADSLPYAGRTVRIAVPADFGLRSLWEGRLSEWQVQTGGNAELVEYAASDPSQPAGQLASSAATLVVFPLDRLGDVLDTGPFAPVPESTLQKPDGVNWLDLYDGLREGIGSSRRQPVVVPLSCPVLVCYYRKDLLDAAKLAPPRTWDDYQKLLDNLPDWAPGLAAVEPWEADFRATMYLARSVAFAKHPGHYSLFFEIETGAPLIDGPGFVRGLEASQKAWSKLDPGCKDFTPEECRRRILNGQAALAITVAPHPVGDPPEGAASEAAGERSGQSLRIGIGRLPGSRECYNPTRKVWEPVADRGINQPTLIGFSGWACAAPGERDALDVEAAWDAVSSVGGQGFVSAFPPAMTGLCRESQAATGAGFSFGGLSGESAAAGVETVAACLQDQRQVIELPVVRRRDFLQALSESLSSVMDGRATPAEGLKTARQSWTRLADEVGPERVRNSYRAALGLGRQ